MAKKKKKETKVGKTKTTEEVKIETPRVEKTPEKRVIVDEAVQI